MSFNDFSISLGPRSNKSGYLPSGLEAENLIAKTEQKRSNLKSGQCPDKWTKGGQNVHPLSTLFAILRCKSIFECPDKGWTKGGQRVDKIMKWYTKEQVSSITGKSDRTVRRFLKTLSENDKEGLVQMKSQNRSGQKKILFSDRFLEAFAGINMEALSNEKDKLNPNPKIDKASRSDHTDRSKVDMLIKVLKEEISSKRLIIEGYEKKESQYLKIIKSQEETIKASQKNIDSLISKLQINSKTQNLETTKKNEENKSLFHSENFLFAIFSIIALFAVLVILYLLDFI